jgi:hypothetical protein
MRVRIVSYEDVNAWILGKFARKLHEELSKLGVRAEIGNTPDMSADINHHIIYLDYDSTKASANDTLMITHIDNQSKLKLIKDQLEHARLGICMSAEMMNALVDYGVDPKKVTYVKPAHDGIIKKKKTVIGITCKVHADGRKREQFIVKLSEKIAPDDFRFIIMGEGWQEIVNHLTQKNIETEYFSMFNYDIYTQMIPRLDYYLYMGQDEGSMGFIDALAAGVGTIVTPQGYHLDAPNGIIYAFNTLSELEAIFKKIAADRKLLTDAVSDWTWEYYAKKHLDLWNYLLTGKVSVVNYKDGIQALTDTDRRKAGFWDRVGVQFKILKITVSRFLHSKDKIGKIRRKFNT